MLIKKTISKIVLPEKYHKAQNICDVFMSQLVEILLSPDYKGLQSTRIDFDAMPDDVATTSAESVLQILIDNDRLDDVAVVTLKRIVVSIVEDFLGFISESFNAVKAAKFPVAYGLLRKPLMDELLMFEQMLIDKQGFVDRYIVQKDVTLYDPSNRKLDNVKQDIVTEAMSKLTYSTLFDAKHIYDVRYDSSIKYGLYFVTNQALHIVTTHRHYRTPEQELNFVFANTDDYEKCWEHYYSLMPMLMMYAASVVDEIVFSLIPDMAHVKNMKGVRRCLADMILCGAYEKYDEGLRDIIEGLSSELEHVCKSCNSSLRLDVVALNMFVFTNVIVCKTCNANQLLDMDFVKKFPVEL